MLALPYQTHQRTTKNSPTSAHNLTARERCTKHFYPPMIRRRYPMKVSGQNSTKLKEPCTPTNLQYATLLYLITAAFTSQVSMIARLSHIKPINEPRINFPISAHNVPARYLCSITLYLPFSRRRYPINISLKIPSDLSPHTLTNHTQQRQYPSSMSR